MKENVGLFYFLVEKDFLHTRLPAKQNARLTTNSCDVTAVFHTLI